MQGIKRQLLLGRNFDFTRKHALGERAVGIISEYLRGATKLVYETRHACVGRANHRATRFDAAKNCIRQVLMRSSGVLKPPVVRHIYQHIRTGTCLVWKDKLSGELTNRVFETDQGRYVNIAIGQSEHRIFFSLLEIAGNLIAYNLRE